MGLGSILAISVLVVSLAPSGWAQADKAPAKATQQSDISVPIPASLKNQGFKLKIDDVGIDLDQEAVQLDTSSHYVPVELYDRTWRLVDYHKAVVDEAILAEVHPRHYRVGFYFGTIHGNARPWKKAFLSGDRGQFQIDLSYFWNNWGLRGGFGGGGQSRRIADDVQVNYRTAQVRLEAVYEGAPFRKFSGYWAKIHVLPALGALFSQHSVKIQDERVGIHDKASTYGGLAGLGVRFPAVNNFAFVTRYFATFERIDLPDVGLQVNDPQHNILGGFSYEF